uniref:Uncharacterized protein n=1 Tax=Arundo donax TaxID=35708 RepID=A0A0A9HRV8_ARUDO
MHADNHITVDIASKSKASGYRKNGCPQQKPYYVLGVHKVVTIEEQHNN